MTVQDQVTKDQIQQFEENFQVYSRYLGTDELVFDGTYVSYHMQDDIDRTENLDVHCQEDYIGSIQHKGNDEDTMKTLILLAEEVAYDKEQFKARLNEMRVGR